MAHFETRDGREVAVKENGKPFRILQLTDIHIGGSLGTRKRISSRSLRLRKSWARPMPISWS